MFESLERPPDSARWTFLDSAAVDFYPDWERVAKDLVAHLRSQAGRNPYDRGLTDLVGDLALTYETMELSADAGLVIAAFDAEPGSRSEEALNLLASWVSTPDPAETT